MHCLTGISGANLFSKNNIENTKDKDSLEKSIFLSESVGSKHEIKAQAPCLYLLGSYSITKRGLGSTNNNFSHSWKQFYQKTLWQSILTNKNPIVKVFLNWEMSWSIYSSKMDQYIQTQRIVEDSQYLIFRQCWKKHIIPQILLQKSHGNRHNSALVIQRI